MVVFVVVVVSGSSSGVGFEVDDDDENMLSRAALRAEFFAENWESPGFFLY